MSRQSEIEKYKEAYQYETYRMGGPRTKWLTGVLKELDHRGDFLDVSTGRGELLDIARNHGYGPKIIGTEVVPELLSGNRVLLAYAHDLPFDDGSFDTVCLIDVLEHLELNDGCEAIKELCRVARKSVLLSANNRSSVAYKGGPELHITKQDYRTWEELIRKISKKNVYRYLPYKGCTSALWRIEC